MKFTNIGRIRPERGNTMNTTGFMITLAISAIFAAIEGIVWAIAAYTSDN